MVKVMNTNKVSIISTIIAITLIIGIPTIYKVVNNHFDSLNKVVEKQVIEKAKSCFYNGICLNEKILLKELYDLGLEKVSNPRTKEYYNENSYVLRENIEFKFIVVE